MQGAARLDQLVTGVAPASNGAAAASGACGDAQPEEEGARGGVPGDPKLTRSAMEGSGRPEEARGGRISRRRGAAGGEGDGVGAANDGARARFFGGEGSREHGGGDGTLGGARGSS